MKKLSQMVLALIMTLAMAISFAACSANGSKDAGETPSASAGTSTEADAASDESGQNPVMNYVGNYQNGGCYMLVEAVGNNDAKITVEWPMTDDEKEIYTLSGTFEPDTMTVHYSNSTKQVLTLDADGKVTDTRTDYTDGSGKIVFHEDGTLDWQDENESERMIGNQTFSYVVFN